jgi:hypothetical protein
MNISQLSKSEQLRISCQPTIAITLHRFSFAQANRLGFSGFATCAKVIRKVRGIYGSIAIFARFSNIRLRAWLGGDNAQREFMLAEIAPQSNAMR